MRHSLVTIGALALTWFGGVAIAEESAKGADVAFVEQAAQSELAAISLAKVAQEKANCVGINALGVRFFRDHTRVNRELTRIAAEKGIAIPTELDAKHQALVATVAAKSGPEFDAAYSTTMAAAHEQSIVLYTAAAASEDKEFARFARLTLPALREHKRLSDVYVNVTAIAPADGKATATLASSTN